MPKQKRDGAEVSPSEVSNRRAYEVISLGFNDLEAMRGAVLKDRSLLEARTGLDETPLHYLAVENQSAAVEALVQLGASVNVRNHTGATPLHEAAMLGQVEMVRLLLKHGADVQARDKYKETPLHKAATTGASAEVIRILVEAGAEMNAENDIRETPLDCAQEEEIWLLLRGFGGCPGSAGWS